MVAIGGGSFPISPQVEYHCTDDNGVKRRIAIERRRKA